MNTQRVGYALVFYFFFFSQHQGPGWSKELELKAEDYLSFLAILKSFLNRWKPTNTQR